MTVTESRRGDRMVEPGVQERVGRKGEVSYRAYLGKSDGKARWSPAVATLDEARELRARSTEPRVSPPAPDSAGSPAPAGPAAPPPCLFNVPGPWRTAVSALLRSSGFHEAADGVATLPLGDSRLAVLFVANTGAGCGWSQWIPGAYQRHAASRLPRDCDADQALNLFAAGASLDLAQCLPNRYSLGWNLTAAGAVGDPRARYAATAAVA